jgi:hypothetical protein
MKMLSGKTSFCILSTSFCPNQQGPPVNLCTMDTESSDCVLSVHYVSVAVTLIRRNILLRCVIIRVRL